MKNQRKGVTKITLLVLLALGGCTQPEVNYTEMFSPPTAQIFNDELTIKGGPSCVASASYVIPHVKIKENQIYIYGTLSFSKDKAEKKITLSQTRNDWQVYWINRDASLIEMNNTKSP